jgi:hypothetical protein
MVKWLKVMSNLYGWLKVFVKGYIKIGWMVKGFMKGLKVIILLGWLKVKGYV